MPRAIKKAKSKTAKVKAKSQVNNEVAEAAPGAPAGAEAPVEELQPPTVAVETAEAEKAPPKAAVEEDKGRVAATSINIAKLQAMSMPGPNQMARDLGVENFGTMRKHEVIIHI